MTEQLNWTEVNLILEHSTSPCVKKPYGEILRYIPEIGPLCPRADYPSSYPESHLSLSFFSAFCRTDDVCLIQFWTPREFMSRRSSKMCVCIWSFLEYWVWFIFFLYSGSKLFSKSLFSFWVHNLVFKCMNLEFSQFRFHFSIHVSCVSLDKLLKFFNS